MSDNIKVQVINVTETVTAFERKANIVGPDGKEYTVQVSYAGEWAGYNDTEWFDADGNSTDTPTWAAGLDDYDIDELTRQDGE